MKKIFFTVGPSLLYPTAKRHLLSALKNDILSTSHRGRDFINMYTHTETVLRKLMDIPKTHHVFFISSGNEGMERIIMNTIYKYSAHIITGAFSEKFYTFALDLKKQAKKIDFTTEKRFSIKQVKIPKRTEVICITQNDTSTGMAIPMEYIYALKDKYPSMLIAIDIVSSTPYVAIDFSKIDMAFFSVQKGFGLPAGLGVLIVNDQAIEKARFISKKNIPIGTYHSFLSLYNSGLKQQTIETPNVLSIYLLGKTVEDMLKKGREKIRQETEKKADLLYTFFDKHPLYKPFASEPYRSKTTLVIDVKGEGSSMREALLKKGFVVGSGYGANKENHIRIANFPAHTINQVNDLIKVIKSKVIKL